MVVDAVELHGVPKDMESVDALIHKKDDRVRADAATAVESEAALFNQPPDKKLIYQVVAINKAGEGLPSNTVSIVL